MTTIDCTPTWEGILPLLVESYACSGSESAKVELPLER